MIYANGRTEGTEVRVATEVPGRVVESFVREGETVARGDVVVTLDKGDMAAASWAVLVIGLFTGALLIGSSLRGRHK